MDKGKEKGAWDEAGVLQPLEIVWRKGAGRDGGQRYGQKMGGGPGHGRQEDSIPSKEERRTGASASPQHRQETQRSREGLGGPAAQGHPPLLADEQEQKHNQAGDECQADPNDGPGVVAGPCRGTRGRWGCLSALASGLGLWRPSLGLVGKPPQL